MTSLNKVKSDITSVFNTLKNMDLTVDNNGEYSIATQVDLDLATRYPTHAKVTPHLAYLYNTRTGWAQYINDTNIIFDPINQFVSIDNYQSTHQLLWLNSDKTTRNGSFLKCKAYAKLSNVGVFIEDELRYNIPDLFGYVKNNLNKFDSVDVKFCDGYTSVSIPNYYPGFDILYTFKYKDGGKPREIQQSHMGNLGHYVDGTASSNAYTLIHDDGVTKVGLQPLRTMRSGSDAVIGSTNQYIQMNDNMTILIYTNKLVYIQKLNSSYDYKVYTYPQMNLIKTGTENSLRDVYIKNNLTRTGLIGPIIESSGNGDNNHLFLNGFILDYNQYDISHIIDAYTMTCPKFISSTRGGNSPIGYNLIYYI